jgi:HAD superfamily hydrolase (TIGR01549 family)
MNLPQAILFDMDGTITEPMLNFAQIRAEMRVGDRPLLEAMDAMDAQARAVADEILHRHEDHAARNSTLNPGCQELFQWLVERKIPTGLVTRNSRRNAQIVLDRHSLRLGALVCREDSPYKPNPAPLHLACRRLGVGSADTWMIGDGQYDVEAGSAANMRTVWISHGKPRWFTTEPWKTVTSLHEVLEILQGGPTCA